MSTPINSIHQYSVVVHITVGNYAIFSAEFTNFYQFDIGASNNCGPTFFLILLEIPEQTGSFLVDLLLSLHNYICGSLIKHRNSSFIFLILSFKQTAASPARFMFTFMKFTSICLAIIKDMILVAACFRISSLHLLFLLDLLLLLFF